MSRTVASDKPSEKQFLRRHLQERRALLSPEERTQAGERIVENVCASAWWKRASAIHVYCSVGTEVPTNGLLHVALREGKRVIVPITPQKGTMLLHAEIFLTTRFEVGKYGIPVPTAETSSKCEPTQILTGNDCVFVPLLGYDVFAHRIGYGAGYYDRFLEQFGTERGVRPLFIGLAFGVQYIEEGIKAENHDIPLDGIMTEQLLQKKQPFP